MANQPDAVIEKAKVLTVSEGSYKDKDGNEKPQWTVVLEEPGGDVTTAKTTKLRDDVKEGNNIERVFVYVRKAGDKEYKNFFFPTEDRQQTEGKGGRSWQGGRQEDVEIKIVSFATAYAKDLYMNTPEGKLEDLFKDAREFALFMLKLYKELKG